MKLTIYYKQKNGYTHSIYTRLFDLQCGHILYLTKSITYQLSSDTIENRDILRQIYFDITSDKRKNDNGIISLHLTD